MAYMKDSRGHRLDNFAAYRPVQRPAGMPALTKLPNPDIYRLGNGRFGVSLDLSAIMPSGGATYYVARNGLAGNTGLTPASPWNLATAITAVNAGSGGDTIVLAAAADEYNATVTDTPLTKSCQILAAAPGVRLTNWRSPGITWTAASGVAGASGTVYSATNVSTNGVFDLVNLATWTDRTGRTHRNYTPYTNMGTGADEAAALALITADGQYAIGGSNIYVRPTGAMDLTNTDTRKNIRIRQDSGAGLVASGSGVVVYVRGIAFEGHRSFKAASNAVMIAEDCSFKYRTGDGTSHDGGSAIHIRCLASANGQDGFNYHDTPGNGAEFIEIDCISGYNGMTSTAENNNATTAHGGMRGIRVGGYYQTSTGPTLADVNTVKSWNLGLSLRDSRAATATNRTNVTVDSTVEVWLDEVEFDGLNTTGGSGSGYNLKTNETSKIHLHGARGMAAPVSVEPTSVGTVDYYDAA